MPSDSFYRTAHLVNSTMIGGALVILILQEKKRSVCLNILQVLMVVWKMSGWNINLQDPDTCHKAQGSNSGESARDSNLSKYWSLPWCFQGRIISYSQHRITHLLCKFNISSREVSSICSLLFSFHFFHRTTIRKFMLVGEGNLVFSNDIYINTWLTPIESIAFMWVIN